MIGGLVDWVGVHQRRREESNIYVSLCRRHCIGDIDDIYAPVDVHSDALSRAGLGFVGVLDSTFTSIHEMQSKQKR